MDVAGQDGVRIVKDGTGLVGKDDLCFCAALSDQFFIIGDIIHAGEFMTVLAEKLSVPFKAQHIAVGVDARFVDLVQADQFVAHLVGGIGQHEDDLLCAFCDASQADGETVAGKDGEDDAHGAAAQLGPDVLGNIVDTGIVALRPGHNGFRDSDHVSVSDGKPFVFGCLQDAGGNDLSQIVALSDDGAADAS